MQLDSIASLLQLILHLSAFVLGRLHREDILRMANRDIDDHACCEHSGKLVLETVENVRITHQIRPGHRHVRQQTSSRHLHIRLGHLIADFQQFDFFTIIPNVLHIKRLLRKKRLHIHFLSNFVIACQIQSTELIKHHFRECQSVFRFGEAHLRFVEFHTHLRQVALCGHTLGYHRFHVLVQSIQKIAILTGKQLLVL